jgi:hypothetical protein
VFKSTRHPSYIVKKFLNHKMDFPRPNTKKFALLIVNTWHLPNALTDALYLYPILRSWGFEASNVHILIDRHSSDPRMRMFTIGRQKPQITVAGNEFLAKYRHILNTISRDSEGKPSSLFISIAGHGGQIRDISGDEIDGLDEYIMPNGYRVLDDDLLDGLVKHIPGNFYVMACTDTCHSGTMFDFPFQGETVMTKKIVNTPFVGVSLSACADHQLDYEIGARSSNVIPLIRKMKFGLSHAEDSRHISEYETLVKRYTVTGALTSATVEYSTAGYTEKSIHNMSKILSNLGQTLIISSTVRRSGIPAQLNASFQQSTSIMRVPHTGDSSTESTNSSSNNTTTVNDQTWIILLVIFVVFIVVILVLVYALGNKEKGVGYMV